MTGGRGRRGGVLVAVIILVAVIGLAASASMQVIFSRATAHRETRGRLYSQKAAEEAYWRLRACLNSRWTGTNDFGTAFQACRDRLPAFKTPDGRALTVSARFEGPAAPYRLLVTVSQ